MRIVSGFALSAVLALILAAPQGHAAPACGKICLETIADQYRAAYVKHDPELAPFAAKVRFSENNVELKFPKGSWRAITQEVGPAFTFSDPVTGNVGFTTHIKMMDTSGYLAVRLKVVNRRITEVEHLLSTRRFVGEAPLQNADGKPLVHDPDMLRPLKPAERVSRAAMISMADAYWESLGDNKGGVLKGGLKFKPNCTRVENGLPFNGGVACDASFRNGTYSFNERVRDRAYMIVDEERGVVFSRAVIDHVGDLDTIALADGTKRRVPFREPHSWTVLETFKVIDGAIGPIEANFIGAPYGTRSPFTDKPAQ